ncbi:hypothetical protein SCHPADRAFT_823103 [Schizopora paradoxa]|uniref:Uncharacterized protein n=1 Tax=Schizopora paradoxa TaxID=27342 RepID=A0A0H2RY28_9AGAM|nr:hypothetical protein SCHPADRAFT_823103 [Schizopora paradoxa]
MDANSSPSQATSNRGRGRGRGRGGLGKYLRARGRGRGGGRPAEFRQRLVLEDEETIEIDEEAAKEIEQKYGKRKLASNADRYKDPEPVLNSDGEVEEEPEIDLSEFLARQRLGDGERRELDQEEGAEEEIDSSLAHLSSKFNAPSNSHKGKVQYVEWDESTEEMFREAAAADANRELKSRFRAKAEKQKSSKPSVTIQSKSSRSAAAAAALDLPPPMPDAQPKAEKEEMEDFLDDLIN